MCHSTESHPETGAKAACLVEEICAAFACLSEPDRAKLVVTTKGDWEGDRVMEDFGGKHWREVPLGVLVRHYDACHLMRPEAYRFYLPAYMLACVENYVEADLIPDFVVSSLVPGRSPLSRASLRALFTPEQRRAIGHFLEYLREVCPENYAADYFESTRDLSAALRAFADP